MATAQSSPAAHNVYKVPDEELLEMVETLKKARSEYKRTAEHCKKHQASTIILDLLKS